jgi:hypothetical protein
MGAVPGTAAEPGTEPTRSRGDGSCRTVTVSVSATVTVTVTDTTTVTDSSSVATHTAHNACIMNLWLTEIDIAAPR